MRVTGPEDRCNELLTESGCVRALDHAPPHTAERRVADLLDERDELAAQVARYRSLLEVLAELVEGAPSGRAVRLLQRAGVEVWGQANAWAIPRPRFMVYRDGDDEGRATVTIALDLSNGYSDPILGLDVTLTDPRPRPR